MLSKSLPLDFVVEINSLQVVKVGEGFLAASDVQRLRKVLAVPFRALGNGYSQTVAKDASKQQVATEPPTESILRAQQDAHG